MRRLRWVSRHLPRRLRKLRKSRGIYRDVCAGRASPAAFTETFAQAAQVPRHLLRRLRKPRKSHGIYRDVCASRASSAAFTETFAQAAQVPRHLPRRLRRLRKSRGICFGVCGSSRKRFQEVGSARNNVATHAHCLTVFLPPPKKNSSR